jgi:hypothetical protein
MRISDSMVGRAEAWPIRLPVLFIVLLFLAGFSLWLGGGGVNAQTPSTVPANGTIPPGGTIPPAPTDPANGLVRVVHLAPLDDDIANTAVDVCDEDNTPISGFTGLVYLSQSGYHPFPPTIYDWQVMTPGCGTLLVDIPPFSLNAGAVLTLYIIGDDDQQPLSTLLSVEEVGKFAAWLAIIAQNINP